MSRTVCAPCMAALLCCAAGCGGSTTMPSDVSRPAALHGEVTDAAGDTASDAWVPTPPDLVRATVDITGSDLTLIVTFAPGTLDRQSTRITVGLDTDRSVSTGIRQSNGLGVDYSLDLAAASGQARILKADSIGCAQNQSCFTDIGAAAIAFAADGMQVAVPRALVGNAAALDFGLQSYVLVAPLTPVAFDFMPDPFLPPGHVIS